MCQAAVLVRKISFQASAKIPIKYTPYVWALITDSTYMHLLYNFMIGISATGKAFFHIIG